MSATPPATPALVIDLEIMERNLRGMAQWQLAPVRVFHINAIAFSTYVAVLQASGRRLGDLKPTALSARTDWSKQFSGFHLSCT